MKQSYEFLNEWLGAIQKLYASKEGWAPNPFRASSAGDCARKLGYTKLYPDESNKGNDKTDPRIISLFQLGHQLHDTERALLKELGYTLTSEEELVTYSILMDDMSSLTIKGRVDGILTIDNENILIDIKTSSNGGFKKVQSMGLPYAYKCQAQLYLDALGDEYQRMWFLYYNKDTSERMVVEYAHDDNISQQVQARFIKVYNTKDDSSLPDREFNPYRKKEKGKLTNLLVLDSHCTNCPFREKCYPAYELNDKGTHFVKEME